MSLYVGRRGNKIDICQYDSSTGTTRTAVVVEGNGHEAIIGDVQLARDAYFGQRRALGIDGEMDYLSHLRGLSAQYPTTP